MLEDSDSDATSISGSGVSETAFCALDLPLDLRGGGFFFGCFSAFLAAAPSGRVLLTS